ncbi:MAG: Rpn family recombination-promoting nuclease/putative transposase [Treponema sp.]|nr:Rpn family recombination-promoting nuclease/putative transposase [Treponema sp.]
MATQTHKRKYKDSLFVHLFCTDRDGPKNFLDLYNALNGTSLSLEDTELRDVHIDGVLYAGQENDVSFLVDGKVVMLCEQQSTVNRNMPLRCLMYIAKIYEQQLPPEIKFKRNVQKIPRPQFFVFYNGRDKQPTKQILSLREAFSEEYISFANAENALFDLQVTVYNINEPTGKSEWEKCRALLDYSRFVTLVNEERNSDSDNFMARAIRKAKSLGILTDFLSRNAKEVENMFFGEYDYDMDIKVQRGEAAHDTACENAKNLLQETELSPEKIARCCSLPLEEVLALKEELATESAQA